MVSSQKLRKSGTSPKQKISTQNKTYEPLEPTIIEDRQDALPLSRTLSRSSRARKLPKITKDRALLTGTDNDEIKAHSAEAQNDASAAASKSRKSTSGKKIEHDQGSEQSTHFDLTSLKEIESLPSLSSAGDLRDFSNVLQEDKNSSKTCKTITEDVKVPNFDREIKTLLNPEVSRSDPENSNKPETKPTAIAD